MTKFPKPSGEVFADKQCAGAVEPCEGNAGDAQRATGGDDSASPAGAYDQVWRVKTRPMERPDQRVGERKGQRCRVLARGAKNTILVEFADGYLVYTCRYYVRPATLEAQP